MSQSGFRNLIKSQVIGEQALNLLSKKLQEYRKTNHSVLDYFQGIIRNYQSYQFSGDKFFADFSRDLQESKIKLPEYFSQYLQIYKKLFNEYKIYSKQLTSNMNSILPNGSNVIGEYVNRLGMLQGLMKTYRSHEQSLLQLSKKYFRGHKNMMTNIDLYKSSFTDVKLIYNMDEKNRRYNNCEGVFKNLIEEIRVIEEKVQELNRDKSQIVEVYRTISKEFSVTSKGLANIFINACKIMALKSCNFQNSSIVFLAEARVALQRLVLRAQVVVQGLQKEQQYLKVVVDREKCRGVPVLLVYHRQIKQECYPQVGKSLNYYLKEIVQKMERRRGISRKLLQFTSGYFRHYEKECLSGFKEVVSGFQKNRKRLVEIYGSNFCKFFKANNTVFEGWISIYDKFMKRSVGKIKNLENFLGEESKVFETFWRELKSSIQRMVKNKQFKRLFNTERQGEENGEQQTQLTVEGLRLQVAEKMDYLLRLVQGFNERTRKNNEQIKIQFDGIVAEVAYTSNQLYSVCLEYKELYFGHQQFGFNYSKFEVQSETTLQKEGKFFEETLLGGLLKENSGRIAFEPELNKIEQFKKLKKPIEVMQGDVKGQKVLGSNRSVLSEQNSVIEGSQGRVSGIEQRGEQLQAMQKEQRFLLTRISYLQEERFVKSFTCGMSDNIILQGRLFITNYRLCFYSKFNTSNIFFGETFIQIPKKDIKKIEKRTNAIVFDNSISITTVNGEVFLTSFFSRNEAFDLICRSLQISNDEVMFEPEQVKEQQEENVQIEQADDLKEELVQSRAQRIEQLLEKYQYQPLYETEFTFQNLNALKFFKLFELNTELSYNRKTYKSFAYYLKDCFEHKQNDLSDWTPNINEYLNSANIKESTPEKFTREINCIVPVPNSGVPFMPKQAKSCERISLYWISKDKYIIESTIQNSGVPYSDTFNIKMQKTYESIGQNKCRFSVLFYVNFNQSTMMKSMIESKSMEESKIAMNRYGEEINKYLRYLQKNRRKNDKLQGIQNRNDEAQSNSGENEVLRDQNQKLLRDKFLLSSQLKRYKFIVIGSLLLNLLLMVVVMF